MRAFAHRLLSNACRVNALGGGVEGGSPLPQSSRDGHATQVKQGVLLWGCGEASPHRVQCSHCGGSGGGAPEGLHCLLLLSPSPFPFHTSSKQPPVGVCAGVNVGTLMRAPMLPSLLRDGSCGFSSLWGLKVATYASWASSGVNPRNSGAGSATLPERLCGLCDEGVPEAAEGGFRRVSGKPRATGERVALPP